MAESLGWAFYGVLCAVIWPAMLIIMYRVAVTVLSAQSGEPDARRDRQPRFVRRSWQNSATRTTERK